MRPSWIALCAAAVLVHCGERAENAAPKAAPHEPPGVPIVAYGGGTARDHHLARTTAENRGIAHLAALSSVDAVSFTLRAHGPDRVVELRGPERQVPHRSTDYVPLSNGWLAKVTGLRTVEADRALQALSFTKASGEAQRDDVGEALMLAEARAVRAVLAPLADECAAAGCTLVGTLSYRRFDAEPMDGGGVQVTLEASPKVASSKALAAADRAPVHVACAEEHGADADYAAALASLDRALEQSPKSADLLAKRAAFEKLARPQGGGAGAGGASSGGSGAGGGAAAEDAQPAANSKAKSGSKKP